MTLCILLCFRSTIAFGWIRVKSIANLTARSIFFPECYALVFFSKVRQFTLIFLFNKYIIVNLWKNYLCQVWMFSGISPIHRLRPFEIWNWTVLVGASEGPPWLDGAVKTPPLFFCGYLLWYTECTAWAELTLFMMFRPCWITRHDLKCDETNTIYS